MFELVRFANMTRFYFLSFFTVFGIVKGITSSATSSKHIVCAKTSSNGISARGFLEASRIFCLNSLSGMWIELLIPKVLGIVKLLLGKKGITGQTLRMFDLDTWHDFRNELKLVKYTLTSKSCQTKIIKHGKNYALNLLRISKHQEIWNCCLLQ